MRATFSASFISFMKSKSSVVRDFFRRMRGIPGGSIGIFGGERGVCKMEEEREDPGVDRALISGADAIEKVLEPERGRYLASGPFGRLRLDVRTLPFECFRGLP